MDYFGDTTAPVVFTSYVRSGGGGRAILRPLATPGATVLMFVGVANFVIRDLILDGRGLVGPNGIMVFIPPGRGQPVTEPLNVRGVEIRNVEIAGMVFPLLVTAGCTGTAEEIPQGSGNWVYSDDYMRHCSILRRVRVDNSDIHHNAQGPQISGHYEQPALSPRWFLGRFPDGHYAIQDVEVTYSRVTFNEGMNLQNFGLGIGVHNARQVRIVSNFVCDNGGDNAPLAANGPAGLHMYDARNAEVRYNEVCRQKRDPRNPTDAMAVDFWIQESVVEYNYFHDNEGWGVYFAGGDPRVDPPRFDKYPTFDNTVRYNVVENNGTPLAYPDEATARRRPNCQLSSHGGRWYCVVPYQNADIYVWGNVDNLRLFNNVVYSRTEPRPIPRLDDYLSWTQAVVLVHDIDSRVGSVLHVRNLEVWNNIFALDQPANPANPSRRFYDLAGPTPAIAGQNPELLAAKGTWRIVRNAYLGGGGGMDSNLFVRGVSIGGQLQTFQSLAAVANMYEDPRSNGNREYIERVNAGGNPLNTFVDRVGAAPRDHFCGVEATPRNAHVYKLARVGLTHFVDAGPQLGVPWLGTRDFRGAPNLVGAGHDLGAFERQPVDPCPPDPPIPGLTVALAGAGPGDVFRPGQTMILTATLIPGPTAAPVDAYVVLRPPDGRFLSFQLGGRLVLGIQPVARGLVAFPLAGEIARFTFTGQEPPGSYAWLTALTESGTSSIIGSIDEDPFTVAP